MATIKKSKKKFIVPIIIVLVIAVATGGIIASSKAKKIPEVKLTTIGTDDIHQTVSLTGKVTAGAVKEYKVGSVATVKEVFVKVGDEVKKDDPLASFDTSTLDTNINDLQKSYDTANKDYKDAVVAQKEAADKSKQLAKEIGKMEKKVAKLEKEVAHTTTQSTKEYTTSQYVPTTRDQDYPTIDVESMYSDAMTTTEKTTESTTKTTNKATTTTEASGETTTTIAPSDRFVVGATVYPSSEYGTVTGGGVYSKSDTVTLEAKANQGYAFYGWYTSNASMIAGDAPVETSNKLTVSYSTKSLVTYYAMFVDTGAPKTTTERSTLFPVDETTEEIKVNDIIDAVTQISQDIATITDDVHTMSVINNIVGATIANAIASGQIDSDTISKLIGQQIAEAIASGIIDSANLAIESGMAVAMVERAAAQIDYQGIAEGVANTKNADLTASQIQLAALYAQYEVYNVKASATALEAQRSSVNATKKTLDTLKAQRAELAAGWKANFDGTITKVDIVPDTQTNLLSAGITLENLDKMVATISLSEYDVHKVKLGMPCEIKTAYGEYEGEVATIAPTATGGSQASILDNVGSMAGISGLSSLTEKGAGVECTVTIKAPDENIIAGFDADVTIETGEFIGVDVVPIESIVLEKTGAYVYLYNDETKEVTKTKIETGANSDKYYQVISGVKKGDRIISIPSADYKEDTFKVKIGK